MARRGQVGHIEKSGKWYVVRFWQYPLDGDRILRKEKICPVSGEGYMPVGDRRRRASEIVEKAGVNSVQQFNDTHIGTTFREQAKWFLKHAMARKRNPIKPKTEQSWHYCVDARLNPDLGDLPLGCVTNATVKPLVAKLHKEGLAASTIRDYVGLVKLIMASKVDENGEQMFPRNWNSDFLDVPVVDRKHQRRPTFSAEVITKIVEAATGRDRMLLALLAGTGLRIGEALGLEIRHLLDDCRTVTIEQSVWNGRIQTPKTPNAYRQVDLAPALAELLKTFIGDRHEGLVFVNSADKALSQCTLLHRLLYRVLDKLEQPHAGFHAFRRSRVTWLRKQRVPEELIRFWLGHAARSVTDGYSQLSEDVEYRRMVAEQTGLGFDLPAVLIPMIPSSDAQEVVKTEC